jgi:FMN reductase
VSERTLVVISGGLRHPSSTRLLADQLTDATVAELTARGTTVDTRVVDLREHAQDIINNLVTGFAAPDLQDVVDKLLRAHGVIAVSPIFNASYSGLFKSFFDVLPEGALLEKPVLIGATGGTARHSLTLEYAMRPLFAYLRAMVVPTGVYASAEDWALHDAADGETTLRNRIDRAARELVAEMRQYQPPEPKDPFALETSFQDLLAQ